jgi:predicted RNA binding protein YcfA (HicA-like mRNA interferase family)
MNLIICDSDMKNLPSMTSIETMDLAGTEKLGWQQMTQHLSKRHHTYLHETGTTETLT